MHKRKEKKNNKQNIETFGMWLLKCTTLSKYLLIIIEQKKKKSEKAKKNSGFFGGEFKNYSLQIELTSQLCIWINIELVHRVPLVEMWKVQVFSSFNSYFRKRDVLMENRELCSLSEGENIALKWHKMCIMSEVITFRRDRHNQCYRESWETHANMWRI